jgi:hypothetical protein
MKRNLKEIMELLHENKARIRTYGVVRLGLFGSCARGDSTETSDLDFIVEFNRKSFDAYMDLKIFLEDLFQCKVDLVIVDTLKPRLRSTILQEAVYATGL